MRMNRTHIVGASDEKVGEDGRVSQFMKVKLSVSASSVREKGLREVRTKTQIKETGQNEIRSPRGQIALAGVFTGHDPTSGSGHEAFEVSRIVSGWLGSGRVGSGRVGSSRAKQKKNSSELGPVTLTRPDPNRPARFDTTRVSSPGF